MSKSVKLSVESGEYDLLTINGNKYTPEDYNTYLDISDMWDQLNSIIKLFSLNELLEVHIVDGEIEELILGGYGFERLEDFDSYSDKSGWKLLRAWCNSNFSDLLTY